MTLSAVVRPGGPDGGAALLTASWNFASSEGGGPDWLVITGTKATLRITVADTSTPLEVVSREGTQKIEFDTPHHIQLPMIQTVVRAWPGLEVPPVMHQPLYQHYQHVTSALPRVCGGPKKTPRGILFI